MAFISSASKMQSDGPDSDLSSSPISSAPLSPHRNGLTGDTIQVASRSLSANSTHPQLAVEGSISTPNSATNLTQPQNLNNATTTSNTTPQQQQQQQLPLPSTTTTTEKPKRQRKKKELGPDGKPIDDGKPKVVRQRKPKEPKDQTASVNGNTTASSRKKIKVEEKTTTATTTTAPSTSGPRQSTLTELVSNQKQSQPNAAVSIAQASGTSTPIPPPPPFTTRPTTSGQKYDPVRGATMEYTRPVNNTIEAVKPQINRASASPSIASLIDPPMKPLPPALRSPQLLVNQSLAESSLQNSPSPTLKRTLPNEDAMDVDQETPLLKAKDKVSEVNAASKASSTAQTPKAAPNRSSPPAPKGTGSGLLSSSDLFGGSTTVEGGERKGVNIDLHFKLDPNGGNHLNVAQEIIKKYGRDAINPRAAAHRERLLQVMAAANKIEGNSADDMSIDLMSDMGDDSNIEMGGMDDGSAAEDKPRKRRKKTEEYDLEDEFIDDTELAWQQQAAVAKDGFFVYSGPLIPAGESAQVEATGAGSRGGKARGGRGRAKATTTTHAAAAAEKKESTPSTTATTTAKGRGGRARTTTAAPARKRPTKAEKEKQEAEKSKLPATVAAPAPSTAPVPPPLPSTPMAQHTIPLPVGTTT